MVQSVASPAQARRWANSMWQSLPTAGTHPRRPASPRRAGRPSLWLCRPPLSTSDPPIAGGSEAPTASPGKETPRCARPLPLRQQGAAPAANDCCIWLCDSLVPTEAADLSIYAGSSRLWSLQGIMMAANASRQCRLWHTSTLRGAHVARRPPAHTIGLLDRTARWAGSRGAGTLQHAGHSALAEPPLQAQRERKEVPLHWEQRDAKHTGCNSLASALPLAAASLSDAC